MKKAIQSTKRNAHSHETLSPISTLPKLASGSWLLFEPFFDILACYAKAELHVSRLSTRRETENAY